MIYPGKGRFPEEERTILRNEGGAGSKWAKEEEEHSRQPTACAKVPLQSASGQDGVTGTDLPSYLKQAKHKKIKYIFKLFSRQKTSVNEGQWSLKTKEVSLTHTRTHCLGRISTDHDTGEKTEIDSTRFPELRWRNWESGETKADRDQRSKHRREESRTKKEL